MNDLTNYLLVNRLQNDKWLESFVIATFSFKTVKFHFNSCVTNKSNDLTHY